MIADHITQATAPRTARTAAASLAAFLDEYPQFDTEPIGWRVLNDHLEISVTYLSPETSRLVGELAQALHTTVREYLVVKKDGNDVRGFACDASFDGIRWYVVGHMSVDAFTRFTNTHNPDPQEWTEAERAEYQALAGSAAA